MSLLSNPALALGGSVLASLNPFTPDVSSMAGQSASVLKGLGGAAKGLSFADVLQNKTAQNSQNTNADSIGSGSSSKLTKTEKQIHDAARGFERTLVRQMLSTIRSASLRGSEDGAPSTSGYLEMADDKLVDSLVAGKGMGFGQQVAKQMLQQPNIKALIEVEKKAVLTQVDQLKQMTLPVGQATYKKIAEF